MKLSTLSQEAIIANTLQFSMLKAVGLRTLFDNCAPSLGLPGAAVECGVCAGGSAAVLWHAAGARRDLWLFDSFQGMPEPTLPDGGRAFAQYQARKNWNKADVATVQRALNAVGVPSEMVHIIPGWFKDTIPSTAPQIGLIAVLHLDGDFYESTMTALVHLYPLVVPGGVIIVDDYYSWMGCKKAVDEYRAGLAGDKITWIGCGQ